MSGQPREQRDLAFAIQSPPLVAAGGPFPGAGWFAQQHLGQVEVEPPPPRFRLGIHFERIYQAWLAQHPTYGLEAANLQIRSPEKTVGEFDLLVDVAGEIEHWELAVKFYINIESPEDASRWFGPDPSDTLAGKLDRLITHQLKISEFPAAQALLAERQLQVQRTRGIVKGRLYHPWGEKSQSRPLPQIVHPQHLRGWWLRQDQIHHLAPYRVAYLEKRYWLSSITPEDQLTLLDSRELLDFLAQSKQIAPQFVLLDEMGTEISRGFILKPAWFAQAGYHTESSTA